MASKERTLILCVDQDNDIGKKGMVQTPVIGVEANRNAATTLAISDPEEADANAMFGAIKLSNQLKEKHPDEDFEVATISGLSDGGVESDRKLIDELGNVLRIFPATGIVLVTDGFSDDILGPIFRSRVPIVSIHHVIVKHSQRIEETYVVFGKYLRMIIDDPYYSRILLGVPGILFVIYGFLLASNQLYNAGLAVIFVIGAVLFLKGFGIYDRIVKIRPHLPPPEEQLLYVSRTIGTIIVILGAYQGVSAAALTFQSPIDPFWNFTFWAGVLPIILSEFIISGIDLMILGIFVFLVGSIVSYYMRKDERLGQTIISAILVFWMRFIIRESAIILKNPNTPLTFWHPLVFYTLASVTTTILAVLLTYRRYKKLPFT